MSHNRITASGNAAAILLPQELLDQMGLKVGDEVDLSVVDRSLILRPLDEAERARKMDEATESVFERRRIAYEQLAKGVDLRARGIDEAQAAELRTRLATFAEDWDSPEMRSHDNDHDHSA